MTTGWIDQTRLERTFMWAGGALFVAALATTAWWYTGPLERASPRAGEVPAAAIAADTLLFSIFALHHSVFARTRVKAQLAAIVPERILRSVYVWIASALLLLVCALWQPVGGVLYRATGVGRAALIVVQLAGLVLTWRAVAMIDALELAGIHPPRETGLQMTGAYRLVRHPIYLGWVLMVFAAPTLTGDRLLFAFVSTAYLMAAIPWEERSLEAAFGESYARYKRLVQWRVIPYIY